MIYTPVTCIFSQMMTNIIPVRPIISNLTHSAKDFSKNVFAENLNLVEIAHVLLNTET